MKRIALLVVCFFMVLTGCSRRPNSEEVATADKNVLNVAGTSVAEEAKFTDARVTELKVYQEILDDYREDWVQKLDEEPDWSIENFGSVEEFKEFCSQMTIPDAIKEIYDEHEEKGTLNEFGEVEFWRTPDGTTQYGSSFILYKDKDEYRISKVFETKNAKEVVGQGVFRKGDNLVIVSLLSFSKNTPSGHTMEYLPEYYTEFYRMEISSDGMRSRSEYIDTLLLKDRNFKKVMICPEFTVVFYPETNEFACVKDSKEIGSRTKVDATDLDGLKWGGCTDLSILNKKNELIYPVILKNENGTSFQLLHVAAVNKLSEIMNMPEWVEIDNIKYPVADENTVYYLERAERPDYEVSFNAYHFTDDLDWLINMTPIIVDGDIDLTKYVIDYDNFTRYKVCDGVEAGYVCIGASNDKMSLWGRVCSLKEFCIYNAQSEGKYTAYISEDGEYSFPNYDEMMRVLETLGIDK